MEYVDELGRGRSGIVYRGRGPDGAEVACKVFSSGGLTKVVQWIFLGAPNPYAWSPDAVQCAHLRREILSVLVPHYFGSTLRVAASRGVEWDRTRRAFSLRSVLVKGRPPNLHHPLRVSGPDEARELARDVLAPLQEHLLAAGFDGLVWQAGKGNPVAFNNFLLDEEGPFRWAWIDLESGVPALFSWNPRALLRFYLPRSLRHGRPLFDDVDTVKLRDHVQSAGGGALADLGAEEQRRLLGLVDELEERQRLWKGLPRHHRSIAYRFSRGDIDTETAQHYRDHPLRWYAREGVRATRSLWRLALSVPGRLARWLGRVPFRRLLKGTWRFLTSQRFRYALSRRYVSRRIIVWRQRNQLSKDDADFLRSHLETEESSAYLADFGVHVAIKPFVKSIEYWLIPTLYFLGFVNEGVLAFALLFGGAIGRTSYTLGRLIQSTLHGREKPWVALGLGFLPVVGNFAYPLQIVYSSTEERDDLARFILYDGFARIGAHLPIWGGRDTWTEHAFNRLPDRIVMLRGRDRRKASDEAPA